ncbi:hypothetical protein I3843_16G063500 [Carya illinoinensis]|nr:hypothetical protein I3843_16G063500 [Carya illinoinensis]
MGVFKIPNNILMELNRIMQHFWWGQNNTRKKIHWCSWEKVGLAKSGGGLGFRNFENFNLAMLTKQGWRLLQNRTSLVAQVLSSKYFPDGAMLKAKLGNNPSLIWSIMAAKPLLEEGLIWRIGNGCSTKLWHDRWLPSPTSFKIQSRINTLEGEAKVAEIIEQDTKTWNLHLIKEIFTEEEVKKIQRIPLSVCNSEDKIIRRYTANGIFLVKSAYHLMNEMQQENKGRTNCGKTAEKWGKLWELKVPNAEKLFLWKASNNFLPTKQNLFKKKVVEDPSCPMCSQQVESIEHALWECKAARDVWGMCSRKLQKSYISNQTFKELLFSLLDTAEEEILIEMAVMT